MTLRAPRSVCRRRGDARAGGAVRSGRSFAEGRRDRHHVAHHTVWTGKTPLVEWAARALAGEGIFVLLADARVRSADERRRVVVSDAARAWGARKGESRDAGRGSARAASVLSDADRVAAARWSVGISARKSSCSTRLPAPRSRRPRIVTVDATTPGRLAPAPAGRLREPRAHWPAPTGVIKRADLARDSKPARRIHQHPAGARRTQGPHTHSSSTLLTAPPHGEIQGAAESEVRGFRAVETYAFFAPREKTVTRCPTRAFPDHHFRRGRLSLRDSVEASSRRFLKGEDAVKMSPPFSLPSSGEVGGRSRLGELLSVCEA